MTRTTLIGLSAFIAAIAMVAAVRQAWPHDDKHLSDWIGNSQHRSPITGEHCCGLNDCFPVEAEFDGKSNSWLIHGTQERVPDGEALPSRDNKFWRCHRPDGSRRCFFKPMGGV